MLEIANIFQPLVDGGVTILEFWQGVTGDWGVAIILLAFTIQLGFLPATILQWKSTDKLDALRPGLKQLEEHYADDKERLSGAVGRLYERQGAGRALAFVLVLLLLAGCVWVAGYYLFEGQAFKDAIGGSEPFLFLPDLAQPLRDDPFSLAAVMALYMGIALAGKLAAARLPPWTGSPSARAYLYWAVNFAFLVPFFYVPAGFVVVLIACSIWTIGEGLVLNKLLPRPAPTMPEDL